MTTDNIMHKVTYNTHTTSSLGQKEMGQRIATESVIIFDMYKS
jgi:hypothetical protein